MNKKESITQDVCFLIASSSKKSYQKLSKTYSAIEPPTWALLLAQSCRAVNFNVSIVDANAEWFSKTESDETSLYNFWEATGGQGSLKIGF